MDMKKVNIKSLFQPLLAAAAILADSHSSLATITLTNTK